jgi:predicted transcriptional regulator YheO
MEKQILGALDGAHTFNAEFRIQVPCGEIRTIKSTGQVIRHKDGTPIRMLGANIDVTDSKKIEQVATDRLHELEGAHRRFELVTEGASVGIWD